MSAGGSDLGAHVCRLQSSGLPCRQGDFTPCIACLPSFNVTGKRPCPGLLWSRREYRREEVSACNPTCHGRQSQALFRLPAGPRTRGRASSGGCSHQSPPPFPAVIKQTSRTRQQPDTHGSGRSGSRIRSTRHPFDFGPSQGHPPEQAGALEGVKPPTSRMAASPLLIAPSSWFCEAPAAAGPQGVRPCSHLCTLARRCTRSH